MGSNNCLFTHFLQNMFNRRKKFIQFWNSCLRLSKWWQTFFFLADLSLYASSCFWIAKRRSVIVHFVSAVEKTPVSSMIVDAHLFCLGVGFRGRADLEWSWSDVSRRLSVWFLNRTTTDPRCHEPIRAVLARSTQITPMSGRCCRDESAANLHVSSSSFFLSFLL